VVFTVVVRARVVFTVVGWIPAGRPVVRIRRVRVTVTVVVAVRQRTCETD